MSATTFSRFQDGAHNLFRVAAGFLLLMTMGPGSLSVDAMREGGEEPAFGGAGSAGGTGGAGGGGRVSGVDGGGGPSGI